MANHLKKDSDGHLVKTANGHLAKCCFREALLCEDNSATNLWGKADETVALQAFQYNGECYYWGSTLRVCQPGTAIDLADIIGCDSCAECDLGECSDPCPTDNEFPCWDQDIEIEFAWSGPEDCFAFFAGYPTHVTLSPTGMGSWDNSASIPAYLVEIVCEGGFFLLRFYDEVNCAGIVFTWRHARSGALTPPIGGWALFFASDCCGSGLADPDAELVCPAIIDPEDCDCFGTCPDCV